jgi:uncharacterized surface protein with fasciclin (FAS1) repeats
MRRVSVVLLLWAALTVTGSSAQLVRPTIELYLQFPFLFFPLSLPRAPSFQILIDILEAARLYDNVTQPAATITLLAPTDAAFTARFSRATLDSLAQPGTANQALREKLLLTHVVQGARPSNTLVANQTLVPSSGEILTVRSQGNTIAFASLGGSVATVTRADIATRTKDSVIHVLDDVLLPASGSRRSWPAAGTAVHSSQGCCVARIKPGRHHRAQLHRRLRHAVAAGLSRRLQLHCNSQMVHAGRHRPFPGKQCLGRQTETSLSTQLK